MKNFYHQKEIKIIPRDDYNEAIFELNVPETYGFNFYTKLDEQAKQFFNELKTLNDKPMLLTIKGEFDLLEGAEEQDKIQFIVGVIHIFVSHIIGDKSLDREKRLAPPKVLDSVNLSTMVKKDITNKEILFPVFSLQVINEKDELIYEVFPDESISSNAN